jgi:hypothetical protein
MSNPYKSREAVAALQETLQGYYNKIVMQPDITIGVIKAMLEDDLKTLREWNGDDIINSIIEQ